MGFMGTGKSAEDKALEKLATYLENMDCFCGRAI